MMNLSFGGDNEYVDAAQRVAAQNKGPSIIASLLNVLGIGRTAAQGPKPEDLADSQTPEGKADTQNQKLAAANAQSEEPVRVSALADAETALGVKPLPMTASAAGGSAAQMRTAWGNDFIRSITPLTQIDPDAGAMGIIKPIK